MKVKSIIAGLALSFMAASSTMAADSFSTLDGIPAEPMSHTEMEQVEGKFWAYNYYWGLVWINYYTRATYKNGWFIGYSY